MVGWDIMVMVVSTHEVGDFHLLERLLCVKGACNLCFPY